MCSAVPPSPPPKASLELEQERTRSLQQEVAALKHDLDAARAADAVAERQRQEHAKMAADSFGELTNLMRPCVFLFSQNTFKSFFCCS